MTQEEKAKTYDETLERAKECLKDGTITTIARDYILEIFPELQESEDGKNKRISKEITQFLKQNNGWNREWLAWLEKQGEQTHAELGQSVVTKTSDQELEPKFKVGDWISELPDRAVEALDKYLNKLNKDEKEGENN